MTRLERWERAAKLGRSPPPHIKEMLLAAGVENSSNNNIWHNRV